MAAVFYGTAQLALVHELLHPSQMIRELADSSVGSDTERETQKREQQIAIELRKVPGKDFPDVVGSGKTYGVPPQVEFQPNSPPLDDPQLVAPIGYQGPARVQPKLPSGGKRAKLSNFRHSLIPTLQQDCRAN